MENTVLYQVLEYILNTASDQEIEVIVKAIRKRQQDRKHSLLSGLNFKQLSRQMASGINQQLALPAEQLRQMVREMVIKLIKQAVPEIPADHLKVLLAQWMPEKPRVTSSESELPAEVLLTMIKHFLKYSSGAMSPGEQTALKKAMPDWHEDYWQHFPENIRNLIVRHLDGRISRELFWQAVKKIVE